MDYSEDARNFYLNEQNKKKRKELEEKYGADYNKVNEDVPPEIESQFLDNIMKFEEASENAEEVSVWEFLGKPVFKKISELKPEELSGEIEKVLDIYAENQINIDIIEKDEVSDEDFYKFITEELPAHKFFGIRVEGFTTNFIYEEFHPSDKLDAKNCVEWFIYPFLERDEDYMKTFMADDGVLTISNKPVTRKEFAQSIFALIEDVDEVIEKEIVFNEFSFGEKNKVDADVILRYKSKSGKTEKDKTISFLFELIKSDYDGFEIKSYECKRIIG